MEIKATLNKPYNEEQRLNFIVIQNHTKGYEIKETESALEAWGLTDEEIAEREKQVQRKLFISQLDQLDLKAIRALRALSVGTGSQADKDKLEQLESQAEAVRQELRELEDEK